MNRRALGLGRKMRVDVAWIGSLRECAGHGGEVFLDKCTGRAVVLSQHVLSAAVCGETEPLEGLSPAERDDVPLARAILDDETGRYVPIPGIPLATRFAWMTEFAGSVCDPDLYARLETLLDITALLGRFEAVLSAFQVERHLWYRFRRRKVEAETEGWLAEYGVTPAGED